jgi:LysM repeat protein
MAYTTKTNLLNKGRTWRKLKAVKAVVIHWVANPKSSASANRNYWERLGSGVAAHDIIDLDGSVLHCVPYSDMAYHVGAPSYTSRALREISSYPNDSTVGIECTHLDWTGKMSNAVYNTLVEHTAYLLKKFGLDTSSLFTHHEIVGSYKDCHRWFTNNPAEWTKFKARVQAKIDGPKVSTASTSGTHTVKAGDTLWGIAQKYNTTVDNLEKANPGISVRALQIGDTINLSVKPATGGTYTIKSGDTLWDIAEAYGVSVADIEKVNPSISAKALSVGQVINLPAAAKRGSSQIGVVEILAAHLNVRSGPTLDAPIVQVNGSNKTLARGTKWKCYGKENGMYCVGINQYVSAGSEYTRFTSI